jgi:alanyl-tRNA synthetase
LDSYLKTTEIVGIELKTAVFPDGTSANDVREIVNELKSAIASKPGVVCAITSSQGKVSVVIAANEAAITKGLSAGDLLSKVANVLGGKGGGKPELAQGGGTNTAAIPQALELLAAEISKTN